jgi:hypothetical protein
VSGIPDRICAFSSFFLEIMPRLNRPGAVVTTVQKERGACPASSPESIKMLPRKQDSFENLFERIDQSVVLIDVVVED